MVRRQHCASREEDVIIINVFSRMGERRSRFVPEESDQNAWMADDTMIGRHVAMLQENYFNLE